MSMPKPVRAEHCDRHSSARGAQTPQKQHAGLFELDAQRSAATIPSSSWERGVEGLCLGVASTALTAQFHDR